MSTWGTHFSQRSQRFVDESEGLYVVPPAIARELGEDGSAEGILKDSLEQANESYKRLVEVLEQSLPEEMFSSGWDRRKAVRQAARAVLPNATETKIFVTANVRAWRHFIEMRGAAFADWEIRRLAIMVLDVLKRE